MQMQYKIEITVQIDDTEIPDVVLQKLKKSIETKHKTSKLWKDHCCTLYGSGPSIARLGKHTTPKYNY